MQVGLVCVDGGRMPEIWRQTPLGHSICARLIDRLSSSLEASALPSRLCKAYQRYPATMHHRHSTGPMKSREVLGGKIRKRKAKFIERIPPGNDLQSHLTSLTSHNPESLKGKELLKIEPCLIIADVLLKTVKEICFMFIYRPCDLWSMITSQSVS